MGLLFLILLYVMDMQVDNYKNMEESEENKEVSEEELTKLAVEGLV